MKLVSKISFCVLAGSLFLLFSCGGGNEEPKEKTYDYQRTDSLPQEYIRNLGAIRLSIEDANVLNVLLKQGGHSFNSSFLNPVGKASGYSNSKMQALNLGVFSSDLNYLVAFEQTQDIENYIKAVMQLSEKMGISKAFDETIIQKLTSKELSASEKSLVLTRGYRNAADQLHSKDRAVLVSLIVVGGWTEVLFIATSSIKTKSGGSEINIKLLDHLQTYQNMIAMLSVFKDSNPDCAEILKEVLVIEGTVKDIISTRGEFQPTHIDILHNAVSGLRSKLI